MKRRCVVRVCSHDMVQTTPAVRRRDVLAGGVVAAATAGCDATPPASARPASQGLAQPLISEAVTTGRAVSGLQSLVVVRHGEVLLQERLRGPALTSPINIKSASKSVLSALVGAAIARGVLKGWTKPSHRS